MTWTQWVIDPRQFPPGLQADAARWLREGWALLREDARGSPEPEVFRMVDLLTRGAPQGSSPGWDALLSSASQYATYFWLPSHDPVWGSVLWREGAPVLSSFFPLVTVDEDGATLRDGFFPSDPAARQALWGEELRRARALYPRGSSFLRAIQAWTEEDRRTPRSALRPDPNPWPSRRLDRLLFHVQQVNDKNQRLKASGRRLWTWEDDSKVMPRGEPDPLEDYATRRATIPISANGGPSRL